MQKIGDSTATANGAGEFTQGQPGSGIDATMITAAWLNAIQREAANVVLGAGIALNPSDDSQLFKAIQAIQAAAHSWTKLTGKPTTVAGFGLTDAFTKTETSNAIQQAVAALVASSPAALDTLNELAAALGNDPNFATTMTNALASKASKATSLAGYGIPVATALEAESGVEDSKPVTVLGVWKAIKKAVVNASESVLGLAYVASQQQADAGLDDTSFVTPKKLRFGFQFIKGPNGAIVFPTWCGGFIFQWGLAVGVPVAGNGIGPTRDITLPLAFPTAVFSIWATNAFSNMISTSSFGPGSSVVSNSVVRVQNNYTSSAGDIRWYAIGY